MHKRILVVDDEVLILESLKVDLEHAGYRVEGVGSGEDALTKLAHGNYHLLVTDLMMDGMSGIELLAKVREQDSDIPVIIITGYAELESAVEGLRLGAADYLNKPYDHEELLLRIKKCLEKQELLKKVKFYENVLPLCSVCKKIRDDSGREFGEGDWKILEEFLKVNTGLDVSHSMCPECCDKLYGGLQWYEDRRDEIIGTKK